MSWGSFWGGFTGDEQKKQLKKGDKEAKAYIDTGTREAQAYWDPIAEQGRNAYGLYQNALGLYGPDKAREALNTIYNNPMFNDMNNMAQRETNALYNSRGMGAGGNAQAASQYALQKNLQNYLGMYAGLGNRGDQATDNLASLKYGSNLTQANRAVNFRNSMAQAAGIGPQNVINTIGAVGSFFGGKYTPTQPTQYGQPQQIASQAGTQANGGWNTNTYANASNNLNRYGLQLGNSFYGVQV